MKGQEKAKIHWTTVQIQLGEWRSRVCDMADFNVPMDHDDVDAGPCRLRMARIKGPENGATPVVFLAGGPGDSGIDAIRHLPFSIAFDRVAQDRDVILLDQRATGDSEPQIPEARILWREDVLWNVSSAMGMLADAGRRTVEAMPPTFRPSMVTPWQSARDLAVLAEVLGYERIHLWGYSYGTHLAMAAMKAIPDRIDRVLLCGFEGPDDTLKLPVRIREQVRRLADLAREVKFDEDLEGRLHRVLDDFMERPRPVGLGRGTVQVGPGLHWLLSTWVGSSSRFVRLPNFLRAMEEGRDEELAKAVRGFASKLDQQGGAYYLCDAASGCSASRWAEIARQAEEYPFGAAINFPFPEVGRAWNQIDLGDAYRRPPATDRPVHVATGTLDGFTPTENFLEARHGFPNSVHTLVRYGAHNDLLNSAEAVERMALFLCEESLQDGQVELPVPEFDKKEPA